MSPEEFALIVGAVIFGGGVAGLAFQRALPRNTRQDRRAT